MLPGLCILNLKDIIPKDILTFPIEHVSSTIAIWLMYTKQNNIQDINLSWTSYGHEKHVIKPICLGMS